MTSAGFFEEGSVYRRVSQEGLLLAGAAAALLLQLAHPDVARGVAEHSDFTRDAVRRLRGTLQFVYAIAFGTREEAEAVSAVVRRMHADVTGPCYRADDPDLQVWVNATLFATARRIYTDVFGPLSDAETEELWAGAKLLALMLGCPPERGPQSAADFAAYWDKMVMSLQVTSTARQLAQLILHPVWPWFTAPLQAVARFITAGLIPAPIRDQYGLAWDRRRDGLLRAGTFVTSVLYPRLPLAVRTAPKAHCMASLRAHLLTGPAGRPAAARPTAEGGFGRFESQATAQPRRTGS